MQYRIAGLGGMSDVLLLTSFICIYNEFGNVAAPIGPVQAQQDEAGGEGAEAEAEFPFCGGIRVSGETVMDFTPGGLRSKADVSRPSPGV